MQINAAPFTLHFLSMPYRQHRLEPNYPGPEVVTTKSPGPPVVVECCCLMVATMDRVRLDKCTRETWRKFEPQILSRSSGRYSGDGVARTAGKAIAPSWASSCCTHALRRQDVSR